MSAYLVATSLNERECKERVRTPRVGSLGINIRTVHKCFKFTVPYQVLLSFMVMKITVNSHKSLTEKVP
jgi:hypothetical protein